MRSRDVYVVSMAIFFTTFTSHPPAAMRKSIQIHNKRSMSAAWQ